MAGGQPEEVVPQPPPHPPPVSPQRPAGPRPIRRRRLAELRVLQAEEELNRAKCDLSKAEARHALSGQHRRWITERERARKAHREAEQRWQEKRAKAATKLQALARGFLVRRLVLPEAIFEQCQRELAQGRIDLKAALRDLRHTCHGLAFLEHDRQRAALQIQAWWRSVLVARISHVLQVHRKITDMAATMTGNATHIQCLYRGFLVRKVVEHLRVEKMQRDREAARLENLRTNHLATKIQAVARSMRASREVMQRRRHTRTIAEGLPWDTFQNSSSSAIASRIGTLTDLLAVRPSKSEKSARASSIRRNSEFPAQLLAGALSAQLLAGTLSSTPQNMPPLGPVPPSSAPGMFQRGSPKGKGGGRKQRPSMFINTNLPSPKGRSTKVDASRSPLAALTATPKGGLLGSPSPKSGRD